MAVPTYDKFIEPVLRYLAAHPEGALAREVHDAAASSLGVSEEDKQEILPSGNQPVYKNRAGWAHDRLKRAGLSSSPRRGYWKLTDRGFEFARAHPPGLPSNEVARLAMAFLDVRLRPESETDPQPIVPELQPNHATELASPDDRLAEAVREMRRSVIAEIMESLEVVDPGFFENIVLDLLHRMGYGTSTADLQRVGRSGDGGIDGVISLDKLGIEKVYIQAKRWRTTVGRPEIQAFYGALAGQRARKGVFITTSSYSQQATDFARSVEGIVLVDGQRLAELMIDHEVGVTSRTVKIPKIDSDYFEEGAS